LRPRIVAFLWFVFLAALAGWLGLRASDGPMVNANLTDLLPRAQLDRIAAEAVSRVKERFERNVVLVVESDRIEDARSAADDLAERLRASNLFRALRLRYDRDMVWEVGAFYFPMRFQLLAHKTRAVVEAGDIAAFERDVLKRYFSPGSSLNSELVAKDPLLLLPSYLESRTSQAAGSLHPENGYLTLETQGKVYVVMTGELADSPFSFSLQEKLVPILEQARRELPEKYGGAEILMAGVLAHAIVGTKQAITEISSVGLGSLLGVIVLLLVVFRSWLPFGLSTLSILAGCLGGFAACIALFGQVHLLTLVFGSSLVGISVDYSLHFFCDRFRASGDWSPKLAIAHIFPGITLGLVTSIIGFSGLIISPFPGMREMAVFSSAGLAVAYGCVLAWYPVCTQRLKQPASWRPLTWASTYIELWRRRWSWPVKGSLAVLMAVISIGFWRLSAEDDVRLLQSPDPEVVAEVDRTRELIGRNLASQFFLVEGRTEEEFLQREERLTAPLRALRDSGQLEGHVAISDFLPSAARQEANRELLAPLILEENGLLDRITQQIGLPDSLREAYAREFAAIMETAPVGLEAWLAHPVSEPYRHLWIGPSERGVFGVVALRGVFDLAALKAVADSEPEIQFIDPAGEISGLFADYRRESGWLAFFSYLLVALLLVVRYGVLGGLAVMAPPVLAAFASLGVLGLLGQPISLFNVMALFLVLGIGVDYGLFFRETGMVHASTFLAIAMSSLTTLLAFGLLAFSRTAAISAFGLTILVGVCVAFLLSPMAGARVPRNRALEP